MKFKNLVLVPIGLLLLVLVISPAGASVSGEIRLVNSVVLPGHIEGRPIYEIYSPWYGYGYFEYEYFEYEYFGYEWQMFSYISIMGEILYYPYAGWDPSLNWIPLDPQLMEWRTTPFRDY
jgi:hypothetical protein